MDYPTLLYISFLPNNGLVLNNYSSYFFLLFDLSSICFHLFSLLLSFGISVFFLDLVLSSDCMLLMSCIPCSVLKKKDLIFLWFLLGAVSLDCLITTRHYLEFISVLIFFSINFLCGLILALRLLIYIMVWTDFDFLCRCFSFGVMCVSCVKLSLFIVFKDNSYL